MSEHPTWLRAAAITSPPLVLLLVYGAAVGQGFISDDFGWIAESRVASLTQALSLFVQDHGFYRPIVALTFAANYAVWNLNAAGYGWTNLVLAAICALLVSLLLRSLGVRRSAAFFGAAVWAMNFHGINMSLLWISGRTALLLILGALAATIGAARGVPLLALGGFAFALWSKEEALGIPLIWGAMYFLGFIPVFRSRVSASVFILGSALLLACYFGLRHWSGAMTPATAPPYYQLSFAPALVMRNILEYADRTLTFVTAVALVGWLILRPIEVRVDVRLLTLGALWILAGYTLTLWVPSRSSLYVCFPSIGAVIAASAVWQHWWQRSSVVRQRYVLVAMCIIPVACAPIYIERNKRWTELAALSSACLTDIVANTESLPEQGWLVLVDDRSHRANLQSAFGSLIGDAVALSTGRTLRVRVESPADESADLSEGGPCAHCPAKRLVLRMGRLVAPDSADR